MRFSPYETIAESGPSLEICRFDLARARTRVHTPATRRKERAGSRDASFFFFFYFFENVRVWASDEFFGYSAVPPYNICASYCKNPSVQQASAAPRTGSSPHNFGPRRLQCDIHIICMCVRIIIR